MSAIMQRIAGAPITWGVDGSPGWGYLMDRDRVMSEMVEAGLTATEIGPDGYLPQDHDELADYMARYDLRIVGGFVPAVLYRPDLIDEQLAFVDRASRQLAGAGSKVMVLGPATHLSGYDTPYTMDEADWQAFLVNLRRLQDLVEENGLETALHPHWAMAIVLGAHVERLLEASDVRLCLDTGHLYVAGADPVGIAELARERVIHVHLKDVDAGLAERVRSGEMPFRQATIEGMFTPLGAGDVDIAGVIRALEYSGYDGWYVLEQDVSFDAEPAPGKGPLADAKISVRFLENLARELPD